MFLLGPSENVGGFKFVESNIILNFYTIHVINFAKKAQGLLPAHPQVLFQFLAKKFCLVLQTGRGFPYTPTTKCNNKQQLREAYTSTGGGGQCA